MKIQMACGAVLMGVLGLCMLAGANREAPLVGHQKLGDKVPELENTVAAQPDNTDALVDLTQHYVERGAPGMALSALERAPQAVRQNPRVAHLWAVALLHEGHASQALEKERAAISGCNERRCPPWVLASALRHEQFLSELVQRGVEDYRRDPDATVAAYGRLSRNVVAVLEVPQVN